MVVVRIVGWARGRWVVLGGLRQWKTDEAPGHVPTHVYPAAHVINTDKRCMQLFYIYDRPWYLNSCELVLLLEKGMHVYGGRGQRACAVHVYGSGYN